MSKHTPGPWTVDTYGASAVVIAVAQGRTICELDCSAGASEEAGRALVRANAHMIAAAPDLLRAVQGALIVFDSLHSGLIAAGFPPIENAAFVRECLHAAIAKAEGRGVPQEKEPKG